MKHFSRQEVLSAIKGSNGITSHVADALNVHWMTAKKWIDRWEATREAFRAEEARVTDVAKNRLIKAILSGEQWAVKFWLTTKGKHEGFTERHELAGVQEQPINLRAIISQVEAELDGEQED